MVCRVATLGLLLCCLVFSFADRLSNTENETVTETENRVWTCPDGWVPHVSDREISCLLLNREWRDHDSAEYNCIDLGGRLVTFPNFLDKMNFVKALTKTGNGESFWIGLSNTRIQYPSFTWWTLDGLVVAEGEERIFFERTLDSSGSKCGFINPDLQKLDMDFCWRNKFYICEKKFNCKSSNYFGENCERKCHCAGEPCNPLSVPGSDGITCTRGCERNWRGAACDTEKQDPEVKYFCINSQEERGKYVHIHINTTGVEYRAIYGLTTKKSRGDWCSSTTVDSSSSFPSPHDTTVIEIPITEASIEEMSAGRCVGEEIGDNIFSWELVIQEYDGIIIEHDLQVNITCDFNNAESLVRQEKHSLTWEPQYYQQVKVTPEPTEDDVTLEVIDSLSGQEVSVATTGAVITLRVKAGLRQGSPVKGVFPYNCEASTPDGKHVKKLLDADGCHERDSPVYPFESENNNMVVTPWFEMFAFVDDQFVTFTCSFEMCFTLPCSVGCLSSSRDKRDTRDRKEEVQHATTRAIRVLPSIPSDTSSNNHNPEYQLDHAPASSRYEVGPFVYLNPVTCTLFLLILLIFLCMYITFLRTLRKSVYDIRKEIEVKRSRDKFLHCGCVQQKDRDYIQA